MVHRFTSLRHSLEKLQEAEYFLAGLAAANGLEFQFNLNAFLSACRSTTFTLQKSMSGVGDFATWYGDRQKEMKADPALSFFLELRNISQHEGPVSYVGGAMLGTHQWSYRFAGNREAVPLALVGVDVGAACADHLVKLANLLQGVVQAFPFASCAANAVSPAGMEQLGFSLADVGEAIGLPAAYVEAGADIPVAEKLRILAREFEPLDADTLARLARGEFRRDGEPVMVFRSSGDDLTDVVAGMIEGRVGSSLDPRQVFVAAIARRIDDLDRR
jgi:hypothetical protein